MSSPRLSDAAWDYSQPESCDQIDACTSRGMELQSQGAHDDAYRLLRFACHEGSFDACELLWGSIDELSVDSRTEAHVGAAAACSEGLLMPCWEQGILELRSTLGGGSIGAYELFVDACAGGFAPACEDESWLTHFGESSREAAYERSVEALQQSCDMGWPLGCEHLARVEFAEAADALDAQEAQQVVARYEELCLEGAGDMCATALQLVGLGALSDPDAVMQRVQARCDDGHLRECSVLAWEHFKSADTRAQALAWWESRCALGESDMCYTLAGFTDDDKDGGVYLLNACQHGSSAACWELGELTDFANAVPELRTMCERRVASGCVMYYKAWLWGYVEDAEIGDMEALGAMLCRMGSGIACEMASFAHARGYFGDQDPDAARELTSGTCVWSQYWACYASARLDLFEADSVAQLGAVVDEIDWLCASDISKAHLLRGLLRLRAAASYDGRFQAENDIVRACALGLESACDYAAVLSSFELIEPDEDLQSLLDAIQGEWVLDRDQLFADTEDISLGGRDAYDDYHLHFEVGPHGTLRAVGGRDGERWFDDYLYVVEFAEGRRIQLELWSLDFEREPEGLIDEMLINLQEDGRLYANVPGWGQTPVLVFEPVR